MTNVILKGFLAGESKASSEFRCEQFRSFDITIVAFAAYLKRTKFSFEHHRNIDRKKSTKDLDNILF